MDLLLKGVDGRDSGFRNMPVWRDIPELNSIDSADPLYFRNCGLIHSMHDMRRSAHTKVDSDYVVPRSYMGPAGMCSTLRTAGGHFNDLYSVPHASTALLV